MRVLYIFLHAHTDAVIDQTIEMVDAVLAVYSQTLDQGIAKYLVGRPVKPILLKYN